MKREKISQCPNLKLNNIIMIYSTKERGDIIASIYKKEDLELKFFYNHQIQRSSINIEQLTGNPHLLKALADINVANLDSVRAG